MGSNKKDYGVCVFCGEEGANSRDHIPPKQMLNHPLASHPKPIVVPAHSKCNRAFQKTDELFAVLLLLDKSCPDHMFNAQDRLLKQLRNKEFKGLKKKLVKASTDTGLVAPDLVPLIYVKIEGKAVDSSLTRIVQALHFYELKQGFLPADTLYVDKRNLAESLLSDKRQLVGRVSATNQFRYFVQECSQESEYKRVWYLIFYETYRFQVLERKVTMDDAR